MNNTERYLKTYFGMELLKKHRLTDTGIWEIRGEDPNCDLGGAHIMPRLGFVEGTLADVLTYATELKGFWDWGAGGTITRVKVLKVNEATNMRKLLAARERLAAQLKKVDQKLEGLKNG